jgi:hypothetical protein
MSLNVGIAQLRPRTNKSLLDVYAVDKRGTSHTELVVFAKNRICVLKDNAIKKIPALSGYGFYSCGISMSGSCLTGILLDGRALVYYRDHETVALLPAPPTFLPKSPAPMPLSKTSSFLCCFSTAARGNTAGEAIFVSDDGASLLAVSSDAQLHLWCGSTTPQHGRTSDVRGSWHNIPSGFLLSSLRSQPPPAIDAVFVADPLRGAGVVLATCTADGRPGAPLRLDVRFLTVDVGGDRSGRCSQPFEATWTSVSVVSDLLPPVGTATALVVRWDPAGLLLAVAVAAGAASVVAFVSPRGAEASMVVRLADFPSLGALQPATLAWAAGGLLLGVADRTGQVAVLTRLGEPLSLMHTSGEPRLCHALLPPDADGCVLAGHTDRPLFAVCAGSGLATLALPDCELPQLVAQLADLATPGSSEALALWRAAVSLPPLVLHAQAIEAARRPLMEGSGGCAVIAAMRRRGWLLTGPVHA